MRLAIHLHLFSQIPNLKNLIPKIPVIKMPIPIDRSFYVRLYFHRIESRINRIEGTGGGRKRLPKFKFSAKFPIGLHVILQIQIKKFENDCYIM